MFLIFYVFQIFHPNPGPNLGIFPISHFSLFLTTIQIIQFVFVILQLFHFLCQNPGPTLFLIFLLFHCYSSQSRSYSVCFSIWSFFRVSHHISFLPCEFLIFLICQFSRHIPVPTVCNFHFSRFLVFLAIFQILQCAIFIFHVFQCFLPHFRLYSVCASFSIFFYFLAIYHVIQSAFPHFQVFHCFSSQLDPAVCVSNFLRFSNFSPKSRS